MRKFEVFKKISFKLEPDIWKQFKIHLIENDSSFQSWVEQRISAELAHLVNEKEVEVERREKRAA